MENTLENKAKFFALYWGQSLLVRDKNHEDIIARVWAHNIIEVISDLRINSFLLLTPLSQITDEDYIELMMKKYSYQPFQTLVKGKIHPVHLNQEQIDFLRSKGYALPYMGLSVEQLVSFGWVKLKEANQ